MDKTVDINHNRKLNNITKHHIPKEPLAKALLRAFASCGAMCL